MWCEKIFLSRKVCAFEETVAEASVGVGWWNNLGKRSYIELTDIRQSVEHLIVMSHTALKENLYQGYLQFIYFLAMLQG